MAKEKVVFDYKKLTIDDMVDYILQNDPTKEAVAFINSFYEKKPAKVKRVPVFNEDGSPVMIKNKKGEEIQKKEQKPIGKEMKDSYNILKAKSGFYERYKDVIKFENAPKGKKVDKVASALARLSAIK